jgi:predicted ribosome quality control (RQC) complex YloA/Tae2 family protein
MVTNYYTLFHVAHELEYEFSGKTISEIFTQHRGELVISFKETSAVIIVGCEPANNFIYLRKTFARARRNSASLFPDVTGALVITIYLHPTDRQLHIRLNDTQELVVQLFGSKANVLLLKANGIITESFLKKSDARVTGIESAHSAPDQMSPDNFISLSADQPLTIALKRALPQFGPVLVRELMNRTGLSGDQPVSLFLKNEIVRLLDTAKDIKEELLALPLPRVYFDGTSPVRFSIIPLNHLHEFIVQSFTSVSEAIQTYRANLYHEKTVLQEKEEIVRVLEREREHTDRTLHKIAEEAEKPNRAEQ